jgi:Tol biopolymer transport system component
VPGVNGTANNGEGRLSPDELTIYFLSTRSGNNDIFTASRASRTDAFGTPQPMTSLNTASAEGWPTVTADGLTLFFESNVSGRYQTYVATRTTLVAQFAAPALVANVNIAGSDTGQAAVLPNQSALYLVNNGTGAGNLYRAGLNTTGQFGTPVEVSTINTPSDEFAPTPTSDELVLYFGSSRLDPPAKGAMDIWMTRRTSTAASWDPPTNVQELNTTAFEWPDWLSPDRCRLYFTRNTGATSSTPSLYVATRM